jgi:L-fucose isomerase-like protein
MTQPTLALYFGNRGFFPEKLVAEARREMQAALGRLGMGSLVLDDGATRFGAVETAEEGRRFAAFLAAHRGEFDGVVLSLPNFGDENGAVAALQDCGVPILVQAYPDEIGRMGFEDRRDAFCGKFSIVDVFFQNRIPFTAWRPHVAHPGSPVFAEQLSWFGAVCRVVGGLRRTTIGAIGARTTAFKTVRFDEVALQKHGVTVESLDLSEVFARVRGIEPGSPALRKKHERLAAYTSWTGVPRDKIDALAKLGVVLDELIEEYWLDGLALRCWIEIEKELGVSPCVLLGELNDRGTVAACELDVLNAVAMRALSLASTRPATCLDWNNNYGDAADKCILFHCGPVPQSLMTARGQVIDHPMFAKSFGAGCGFGCNVGRIAPAPISFASAKTDEGRLVFYLGEGEFTSDPIEPAFFGCAGVAAIDGLQDRLLAIGKQGFRHHVSVTVGHVATPLREAFREYLGYAIAEV